MEYIEREALKTELQKKIELSHNARRAVIEEDFIAIIDDMPDADVVEVVRCKDCVNWCGFEHCKNGICDVDIASKRATYPDDYCSRGERKDGE